MRKETLKLMSGAFIMAAVLCSGLYKTARSQPVPDPVGTMTDPEFEALRGEPGTCLMMRTL